LITLLFVEQYEPKILSIPNKQPFSILSIFRWWLVTLMMIL